MCKTIISLLLLALWAGAAPADTAAEKERPGATPDKTREEIECQQKELGGDKTPDKASDDGLGAEGLKPVTEVDAEKLVDEILKRMERSETQMLGAKTANTGGLQEEIVQGINRVHGNIIRDVNKLIDWAKMFKKCDDPKGGGSGSDETGEIQQSDEQKKQQQQQQSGMEPQPQDNQPQSRDNNQSRNPATQPYLPNGGDFKEDVNRVDAKGSRWGDLPEKERDEIEHSRTDGKIPKYQQWIEDYMKRLNAKK